ncbi:endonuclease/exonuclease/phosphatase family protein [Roseinatronobacter monicus]|uniref:endonuclease/exonuclease/phosphatase family protein n=1 Tax=Roseinatronobacter monicus TaxID=393481 RepID=UPI003F370E8F
MSDLIVSSYNIHKAVGTDMRRDPTRTVQVIQEIGADIVALQEVDRRFGDRRGVLDPEMLHSVTGLVPVALTDRLGARAHGWHGNLLLLHGGAEVEEARAVTLPGLEPRGAIVADIRINGQPLRVITAHLGLLHQSRLLQARFLSKVIEEGDGRPTLVMGDFNEWRLGAGCSLMPLRRELRAVKRSAQTIASFPAQMPVLPLDRIIGCRRAEIGDLRIHDSILARKASDHLPIRAALNLPRVQSAVM